MLNGKAQLVFALSKFTMQVRPPASHHAWTVRLLGAPSTRHAKLIRHFILVSILTPENC